MEEHISNQRQWHEEGEGLSKCDMNPNSNSNEARDTRINDYGQHDDSCSRTKTASLSQTDYSEELFKVSQHLRKAVNEVINAQEEMEVQAPPGFEKRTANHGLDSFNSVSKSKDKLDAVQGEGKGFRKQITRYSYRATRF